MSEAVMIELLLSLLILLLPIFGVVALGFTFIQYVHFLLSP